ncbi:actin-like isoform X2 [Aphis gossypii]|nr:actin-like isoform X2 [Aphis gossypii]XP_050063450.1 actin-like isoform X2 [Aphis gossypii]XP_050063451.1 actin-like isoform X2 [Aphis gossypii]
MLGTSQRPIYGGQFAKDNQGVLNISDPIKNCIITDWDAMEDVWFHMYYEQLLIPPENYAILHTEPTHNSIPCRDKLFEIMFEVFNVPKVLLMNKSTLSLYSCGKTTGLVVDSGYESTQVIPIYEGYPISHAMRNMPVGGWHLTQFLKQMINSRGYSLTTTRDWERIKHMKQTFCYCAIDFQKELSMFGKDKEQRYTLPDGMIVNINNEAIRCSEAMFDPTMLSLDKPVKDGIHSLVQGSIGNCNVNERNDLYDNIFLAGGNTLFSGFPERLKSMIDEGLPGTEVRITAPLDREYSTWIGGSVLASSSYFQRVCIDSAEYGEKGAAAIQYKNIRNIQE